MTRALHTLPLVHRDDLGAGYYVLRFGAEQPLAAKAGQFAMVRSPEWGETPLLPRPMSLLTAGQEPSILIKVVGAGTQLMADAPLGQLFSILAPLGQAWVAPESTAKPVLIAGGVGVAPLVYWAKQLAASGHRSDGPYPEVLSLYGGRTMNDLPLAEDLAEAGCLQVTTEDGSRGTAGRVTRLLEQVIEEHRQSKAALKLYTCGPHGMMAAVAKMAADAGIACDASLEAPMGCGYGVCLGCPVGRVGGGYLYTCVDGPCVDAAQIDWTQGVF